MSKAFTSEETEDQGPVVRAPPKLAPGEVRYVTPEGYAELQQALAQLKEQKSAAQPPADLDPRITLIESTLAALTVLGPDEAPEGRVAFAIWVTVEDEDGQTLRYRIVGPDEVDPRQGKISVHSPIARALMGREPGEAVEVKLPGGSKELAVVAVSRTE